MAGSRLAAYWLILVSVLGWPPHGLGVINTCMAEQLGFDRTMLGRPGPVLMLVSGLPAPLVALLVLCKGTAPRADRGHPDDAGGESLHGARGFGLVLGRRVRRRCAGRHPALAAPAGPFLFRRPPCAGLCAGGHWRSRSSFRPAVSVGVRAAAAELRDFLDPGDWRTGWGGAAAASSRQSGALACIPVRARPAVRLRPVSRMRTLILPPTLSGAAPRAREGTIF